MRWSFLAESPGTRDLTSSSYPAPPPNTRCGSCISKQQQQDRHGQSAIPCSPPCGSNSFLVVVMKPMSDLCWICQQNSTAISRSANQPEEKTLVHNTSTCTCRSNFHRHIHKNNHGMYNHEGGKEREGGTSRYLATHNNTQ